MIVSSAPARPVPRWVHTWAYLTLAVTVVLLVLGQLVTTFRAGMADPVWPTEPWYLLNNYKLDFGYLVEHTHRIAGFTVGIVATVLVLAVWWAEPRKVARWAGLIGLVVLLGAYGGFHGALIAQKNAKHITWPMPTIAVMGATVAGLLGIAATGIFAGTRGSWLRLVSTFALIGVMIQGLLGGFRVRLNALLGTDLAAVHGVFAQIVFSMLVAVVVLSARPPARRWEGPGQRSVSRLSLLLVALLLVQLVWGALVRHAANPLNQRLHFLTAFLVVAAAVWLIRAGLTDATARQRVALACWALAGLVALQVGLGVEAWMGKFGRYVLPELEKITPGKAATRTAHTLIGTALLGVSVALALRTRVAAGTAPRPDEPDATTETDEAHDLRPALAGAGVQQPGESR